MPRPAAGGTGTTRPVTLTRLSGEPESARADFVATHLRALECSARKFAGEDIGFVDEVKVTSTSTSASPTRNAIATPTSGWPSRWTPAPTVVNVWRGLCGVSAGRRDSRTASMNASVPSAAHCANGCGDLPAARLRRSSSSRWWATNRGPTQLLPGDFRSKVAINTDLTQHMSNLPNLIAHEAYPPATTEHRRKEQLLVGGGQREQTIFLVNTPQPDG